MSIFREVREDYKINELIENIRALIEAGNSLFKTLERGTEHNLILNPENMYSYFNGMYFRWTEIAEKLDCLKSRLDGFEIPFSYLDKNNQMKWKTYIDEYLEKMYCVRELVYALDESYNRYSLSGSSGNPPDVSWLCMWQCMYCKEYLFIREISMDLIEHLNILQDFLHRAEERISMACVYASPECMGRGTVLPEMMREYTDNCKQTKENDDVSAKNVRFCMHCGESIANQKQYCHTCGKNVQATIDPAVTIQFCRNCGEDIPLIAAFCPFCGKRTR
ncbi:MAG: zinc ribbon domain-containing protein [Lachnospiraceae bacterium]|nr:zinc ribbon domain-containing protein [Lachnospiraceae bacterium]